VPPGFSLAPFAMLYGHSHFVLSFFLAMDPTPLNQAPIGGRYRVLRLLGTGPLFQTYLAEDGHRFQELCVLKAFDPQGAGPQAAEKAQRLFEAEAGVLYQLNHPQIPRFRELLRQGPRLFLVQDYIEGPTYRELIDRRRQYAGRFSTAEVMQFLQGVLPVLPYLHDVGLVHRDLAPANLIQRNQDGLPVLIELGRVKQLLADVRYQVGGLAPDATVTRLGRTGYAPPEPLAADQITPSVDLYAVGAIALVLLTGTEPAALYDPVTCRYRWQNEVAVHPALAKVLDRLVDPFPSARFQRAEDVLAALAAVPADASSFAAPATLAVAPGAPAPTAVSPSPPAARASAPSDKSGSGLGWALGGLALALAVGIGLWWGLRPLAPLLDNGDATEETTDGPPDVINPAFSEAEQARKQALQARAQTLQVDRAYLTRLTDWRFYRTYPERQGIPLSDQPQDAELRAAWDGLANDTLDQLEATLSAEARARLGTYSAADLEGWTAEANQLYVSSRALEDLADGRLRQLFPAREGTGPGEPPWDQIWFGLAYDSLLALEAGQQLTEIRFEPGRYSQQLEGQLDPGHGQVYVLNLSAGQLTRLNVAAPANSTLLSLYLPSPTADQPYLLADAADTTWSGELPQSGYYEIVVVSKAEQPITYRLNVAADQVVTPPAEGDAPADPEDKN